MNKVTSNYKKNTAHYSLSEKVNNVRFKKFLNLIKTKCTIILLNRSNINLIIIKYINI